MSTADTMQLREDSRTSVMLSAVIEAGKLPTLVKIRNISKLGSMLEIKSSLSAGELFFLTRGDLVVEGRIVWSEGTKCGVQFNRPTAVRQWMLKSSAIAVAGDPTPLSEPVPHAG